MDAGDTPFPATWCGTSLDNVGLAAQRPRVGTYGCYEHASLPPLPVTLDGRFTWLTDSAVHDENIGVGGGLASTAAAFVRLKAVCHRVGIALPPAFSLFLSGPDFQQRIRSNTDCYLSLTDAPVPSPRGDGTLIRFLADSQGCIYWYLYLPRGSNSEHAVLSSYVIYGPDADSKSDTEPAPDGSELMFNEGSFEAFMCRFWLENEAWFSEYEGKPMPELAQRYVEAYKAAPASKLQPQHWPGAES